MKNLILLVLIPFIVLAQPIQNKHKSVIAKMNVETGGGAVPVLESFTTDSVVGTVRLVLDKPSGVEVGDLLVIGIINENTNDTQQWNSTVNKPTGFTFDSTYVAGAVTGLNAVQCHVGVFHRIADGTESDTIGIPCVGTGKEQVGFYLRISGVYTSSPIDVYDSPLDTAYYNTFDTIQVHSQTTNFDNELALMFAGCDGGNYYSSLSGTGWSLVSSNYANAGANGITGLVAQKDMASAGATGIVTVTWTAVRGAIGLQITVRSE